MQLQVKAKTGDETNGQKHLVFRRDLNLLIGFKSTEVKFEAHSCSRWCDAKPTDSLKCH